MPRTLSPSLACPKLCPRTRQRCTVLTQQTVLDTNWHSRLFRYGSDRLSPLRTRRWPRVFQAIVSPATREPASESMLTMQKLHQASTPQLPYLLAFTYHRTIFGLNRQYIVCLPSPPPRSAMQWNTVFLYDMMLPAKPPSSLPIQWIHIESCIERTYH